MAVLIRRLERDDQPAAFDCGDSRLNDYLRRYAWQNQQRNQVGVTYVAVDDSQPRAVIGYYTLAAGSLPKIALRQAGGRALPYSDIPVILLGRLAVDRRFQSHGIGTFLLGDAISRALAVGSEIGCRGLVVDAYPAAVSWYAKFGFVRLGVTSPASPAQKMFLDLRTAAAARRR